MIRTHKKDAAIVKALEELGLRKDPTPASPQIADLLAQLDNYESELGRLDPTTLSKYLKSSKDP
jgi:hypothetical protein